ncbi:3-oxoacyl-ACP reductase FabG [SAR86 cluster bacterium]|nr:3-oxoacyl-ACP reductase FabG [SAR86 cluster bacterium]
MSAQKKVLVTGASRGIGKAILKTFANEEHYLVGTATSAEGLKTIEEILTSSNSSGEGIVLDLNDDVSLDEFFIFLKDKDIYPDILVNNAGFTRDNIFLRMKDDEWSDVLNVHLNAQFKIIKNLIKPMLKNKYGRIINLSSAAAAIGNKGQANYVAAKSGVEAMSRTLAREFGQKNITINCVAPGFIETDMTDSLDEEYKRGIASQIPLQRFGKAEEVAELIKFLTSSEADYITGQTIHINGGLFM